MPGYLITSVGSTVRIERSCFYGMGPAEIFPVLLANESDTTTFFLMENNDSFVEGSWTCGDEGTRDKDRTCQEVVGSSTVCLAPNVNTVVAW